MLNIDNKSSEQITLAYHIYIYTVIPRITVRLLLTRYELAIIHHNAKRYVDATYCYCATDDTNCKE